MTELHRRLDAVLRLLGLSYEILLVDDGSRDATAASDRRAGDRRRPACGVLHLSRNFGHQAAVSAGIDHARGRPSS